MSGNFVPKFIWSKNETLLSAVNYRVTVPPGLNISHVREPIFVDVPQMNELKRSETTAREGEGLVITHGLVTRDLKVSFDSMEKQWRSNPVDGLSSSHGPVNFEFRGGDLFLELSLGIYVLNPDKPDLKNKTSVEIFAIIYSHELLHVLDEIDLLTNWIKPKLEANEIIKKYLKDGRKFTYGTKTMPVSQIKEEFYNRVEKLIEGEVLEIWATEGNRRKAIRDSPSEYRTLSERVDELRRKLINK